MVCADLSKPFILTTDASNETIGAVLSQGDPPNDHPIAYMSRSLSKSELNYSKMEKECLAVIAAVQYFKHYLYGLTFTVYGDHELLTWIDSIKDPMSRLNRWRARLRGYDYKFIYKPGKLNTNADALSRNSVPKGESMNSVALPRQLLRWHQCETAFSSKLPGCDASGEDDEPQLKVRACPIKIPRPTKTSLA